MRRKYKVQRVVNEASALIAGRWTIVKLYYKISEFMIIAICTAKMHVREKFSEKKINILVIQQFVSISSIRVKQHSWHVYAVNQQKLNSFGALLLVHLASKYVFYFRRSYYLIALCSN